MIERLITIFETRHFLRATKKMISEEERARLIFHLENNPKGGDVIAGTGGIRKLRWSKPSSGKRGGIRVIYYFYDENGVVFLLSAYAKNDQTDLSSKEKKDYVKLVKELISAFKE